MLMDQDRNKPETGDTYDQHRDRCELLRDLIEDLTLVWGESCKELLPAIDAYEREPLLLAELEQLRKTVAELRNRPNL